MKKIGLISDTHSYLDEKVFEYFKDCDEIWHAGDFGNIELSDKLKAFKPLVGVYGNIDDHEIRSEHPLHQRFVCEGVRVWMTHIGGYPGRYHINIKNRIKLEKPDLFITGHSHILKVMRDPKLDNMLHLNPGAAGNHGFHRVKTLMRFDCNNGKIENLQVIELGPRA